MKASEIKSILVKYIKEHDDRSADPVKVIKQMLHEIENGDI